MKLTTSEVDKLQEKWISKHGTHNNCKHNVGYGHEKDDKTGCDCDCFCLRCGMRHSSPDFFKEKMK